MTYKKEPIMRTKTNTRIATIAATVTAMLVLAACSSDGSAVAGESDCPMTIAAGEQGYWLTAQRSEPSGIRYVSNEERTIDLVGTGSLQVFVFDSDDSQASIGSMDITDVGGSPCNYTVTIGEGGNVSAIQP